MIIRLKKVFPNFQLSVAKKLDNISEPVNIKAVTIARGRSSIG